MENELHIVDEVGKVSVVRGLHVGYPSVLVVVPLLSLAQGDRAVIERNHKGGVVTHLRSSFISCCS